MRAPKKNNAHGQRCARAGHLARSHLATHTAVPVAVALRCSDSETESDIKDLQNWSIKDVK